MKRTSKTGLFLMELLIAILVFAISAAVCMQVFAEASRLSAHSDDLSCASLLAQSAAEACKAGGGSPEEIARLLSVDSAQPLTVWYDEHWQQTDNTAKNCLTVELAGQTACIRVTADGTEVFTLSVRIPKGGAAQ